jgi:hypothetical protein
MLTVTPFVVSCDGGHVAVVVSPCHHCTVATMWMAEGGMAKGIGQEEEATGDNTGCIPSLFWTAGVGKPDKEAR